MGDDHTGTRLHVLVVEDEPLQRMMAIDLVEDAGFEAIGAADAEEAVRILEARSDIRIVFTDIDMPGSIDGMMLAVAIRDRWPPIEIIITSGHIREEEVVLPVRGVFFPKPYDTRRVTQKLVEFGAPH
ncbi:response regulator [Rhizobium sp. BE258]|uniref:response regulator n=1 Tax=Rhizobium sp. BE258 TaxID=2817722 RepID=UPI0028631C26|nr:response regulator [Rhizobium sp. BE258]MDR7146064.1 CheY-like chemotaxis protein [Rhizobium sp. BE258]